MSEAAKIIFNKKYEGFDSISDIERDIYEMWPDIPDGIIESSEFEGTMEVTITYTKPEEVDG